MAAAAKYEEYILAPSSRTIHPVSVYKVNGTVSGAESLIGSGSGSATFQGVSAVTFDFGKNIAGIPTLSIGNVDAGQYIGITFTESSLWISGVGSDGTADAGLDQALWFAPTAAGDVTPAREYERGGFRYLSLIHNTTGNLEVKDLSVHFTPMPHWKDDQLKNYTGYFHCNDDLINRIWYAGAYTNQMCTIDPHHGNSLVHIRVINSSMPGDTTPPNTWYNNFTITNGSSALVDGAKRDRLVWAGDMAIAVPGIVVSYNDLVSVANSLDSLFNLQNKTSGQLPYSGTPFPPTLSFTYHLYTLIGIADYYMYSQSLSYLSEKWSAWKLAMNFSLSFIDETGLMNVTSPNDWLRFGMGGHNIEANSILYYTLLQGITLGAALNESSTLLTTWSTTAAKIKSAANALLWDASASLYKDNETTTLHPQDGNVWAIMANLTTSPTQNTAISTTLQTRWGTYGAPAPEAGNAISPFISGFELQSHFLAARPVAGLNLMRLQWGFMLNDPRMTNSTFIEGYASDGKLHYAPYSNDPRVSHAHGWATGPTSTLTFFVAGIKLLSAGGKTWEISPQLGDLTAVEAGFVTGLGMFASEVNASSSGAISGLLFETPAGTMGSVNLPASVSGKLVSEGGSGTDVIVSRGVASSVPGGQWRLVMSGNGTATASGGPAQQTGNEAGRVSMSVLAMGVGVLAWFL